MRYGASRYSTLQYFGTVRMASILPGLVWYDKVWRRIVRYGAVRIDFVNSPSLFYNDRFFKNSCFISYSTGTIKVELL